jgi:hypothetical protein
MWSHYANGHKGFLLEFNVGGKLRPRVELEKGVPIPIYKVRYVSTNTVDLAKMCNRKGLIPDYQFRDWIYLRKTKIWKYEGEYRAIKHLESCETYKPPSVRRSYRDNNVYLFPMSIDCILTVTFGVNTPVEDKKRIIKLCAGYNITFLQVLIDKDEQNQVRPVPINLFGSIDTYLDMPPQLFTFDSKEMQYANKPVMKVESLQEIPYYAMQKGDYDSYYVERKNNRGHPF